MKRNDYYFYSGIAEAMTRYEMETEYSEFAFEVHELVGDMLAGSKDKIRTVTDFIDTPALAVQALRLNIGRELPDLRTEGEWTRTIEPDDIFTITHGPDAVGSRIFRFVTTLERVPAVELSRPTRASTILSGLFYQAAASR